MDSTVACDRRPKRPSNRPAMQIYRPPGLRLGEDTATTKPSKTAGGKQLKKESSKRNIEENNNEPSECVSSCTLNGCTRKSSDESDGVMSRADSRLSNDSSNSSKRSVSRNSPAVSPKITSNGKTKGDREKNAIPHRPSQKDLKRKTLSKKDIDDLATNLRGLQIQQENSLVEQFVAGNFENNELADSVGQMLVHYVIEENRQSGRTVARIAAILLNSESARAFYQGTLIALSHYFECRDRLRTDHFRVWIAFLTFISDIYSSIGCIYEGELVDLVFRVFDYMLKAPVLDTLKIEELESLIGCLLNVGYDLERQCPDQLTALKDIIRDAFVDVQEPWARKMILLLMELGASGWKLPPEANEYYFQHTSS
ncbi:hypothetical protein AB6A40_001088 [Gnathostoma spinigerum]|uniref:MIF4G domain-containing protein n=1 Tax=Gnathostoma spinigerum TaxID=75299 RepID=A0ABD6E881_9BILA